MGPTLRLILFTVLFQPILFAGPEGLWRIETDLGGSQFDVYHLFVHSADQGEAPNVDFYFGGWRPGELSKVGMEGTTLLLSLDQSGAVIRFEVDLHQSPSRGTASLFHPQAQKKGKLIARKMFYQENWEPFQDLFPVRTKTGRIDLVEYSQTKFEGEGFQDFMTFWWEKVTPRFYPLISFSIYSVEKGIDEAQLRSFYESLKETGKESYSALDDRLVDAYDVVIGKIEGMPGLMAHNTLVVVPPFPGLETNIFNINELLFNYFVLTDVKDLTQEQLQVKLARSVLEIIALRLLPRQGSLSRRLHGEIAILHALRSLNLTDDPALLLGMDSTNFQELKQDLAAHKARMLEDLKERDRTSAGRHFSETPSPGKLVALDFVEKQTSDLSAQAVFKLTRKELGQHLATYFELDQ